VRRPLAIALLALCAAGCGSGGHEAATTATVAPKPLPSFATARAKTLAAGTARFRETAAIDVGGNELKAYDRGTVALDGSRAHIYKLSAGTSIPGEVIVVGDVVYSNENVQAAMSSPDVKPWTKLDRRALTAGERASRPDELAHILAPVYLAYGARAVRLDRRVSDGALYWARVDPVLALKRMPPAARAVVATAIHGDYPSKQFNVKFWIDAQDRIRPWLLVNVLDEIHKLIGEGHDIRGYFHWTLTDNFEWTEGWRLRFGLVELDPATQARTVRPSGRLYAEIARSNLLSQELRDAYGARPALSKS